jgi:hypothetical protein
MSIANLEQPNNLDIFCNTLTINGPSSYNIFTFKTQTVGAVSSPILTNYVVANNTSLTCEIFANGYDIAGASPGSSTSLDYYDVRIKNVGGVVTVSPSSLLLLSFDSDPALNAATLSFSNIGNTFSVSAVGVAGETINWSGNISFYF